MKGSNVPVLLRSNTRNLTGLYDDAIMRSYEGQAHFGGTGPADARCSGCKHWRGGGLDNRACQKFVAMTGVRGKTIPGSALACKYFEQFHLNRGN
jgi:hypothetical protein